MASKLEIKNRIRSVESTKKITRAMQLVAASKLKKCKGRMEENREYAGYLKESIDSIMVNLSNSTHPYLMHDDRKPSLIIVYTSDMGLCGSYNANTFHLLEEKADPKDFIIVLGSRGAAWMKRRSYQVIDALNAVDEEGYEDIAGVADQALKLYTEGKIGKIQVLYTRFVNSMTFEPHLETLLPVEQKEDAASSSQDMIFEPQGDTILDTLIPMFLKSLLYSYWLETKTSENGSRQNAMENATDNAEELRDQLELSFNQARQAAITQEITEIVGGANAL